MPNWSAADSKITYRLDNWSEGYVHVGENGQLLIRPKRDRVSGEVDMQQLLAAIDQQGIDLPVLVRFQDILKDRVELLCNAFQLAFAEYNYPSDYTAVYPIKVNQQFSVVADILKYGQSCVGLEAGSKPELMAVLSLAEIDKHVIICNGYKDREYIRLALIARRLGHRIYIVLEKTSELEVVIEEAENIGVEPLLGVRLKLASMGKGKWQNTGGEKAKFGLTASQILQVLRQLNKENSAHWLKMLHFHMGSQIADLMDIKNGLSEAAQYFAELSRLGTEIDVLDIGGGIGVDYEGSAEKNEFSVNYTLNDYANAVIESFSDVCQSNQIKQPAIITEAGRAMTAHHAVLVTEVINAEQNQTIEIVIDEQTDNKIIDQAQQLYRESKTDNPLHSYKKVMALYEQAQAGFLAHQLTIENRAALEKIVLASLQRVKAKLRHNNSEQQQLLNIINEKLADKLVCNFSVFQSVPDVWGISQIFPVVPMQRLHQRPDRRAIIQDLTCDSDGQIERYVDAYGIETSLPVHLIEENEKYRFGIFMVGAYQEILGDMHNLFGDTNTINVELDENKKPRLIDYESGDTVLELLNYVHFETGKMMKQYKAKVAAADLTDEQARQFLTELYAGLEGYTYLE